MFCISELYLARIHAKLKQIACVILYLIIIKSWHVTIHKHYMTFHKKIVAAYAATSMYVKKKESYMYAWWKLACYVVQLFFMYTRWQFLKHAGSWPCQGLFMGICVHTAVILTALDCSCQHITTLDSKFCSTAKYVVSWTSPEEVSLHILRRTLILCVVPSMYVANNHLLVP